MLLGNALLVSQLCYCNLILVLMDDIGDHLTSGLTLTNGMH